MSFAYRRLFIIVLMLCFLITGVSAQDTPTVEPPTATAVPTIAPTATAVPTDVPTIAPTATAIPTDVPTPIPSETYTLEPTLTPVPTETWTQAPTETPTLTPSLTVEPSLTPSATNTSTATATSSLSPSPSLTASVTLGTTSPIQNQVSVPASIPVICTPSAALSAVALVSNNGTSSSSYPSISSDGSVIAFTSTDSTLVANDTNGLDDIFVYVRQTCAITRVSVAADGTQANGRSTVPAISGDGRYVAFLSEASNLVSGDTNGKFDVFVKDTQTGAVTRAQVNEATGNTIASVPTLSNDGHYLAYEHYSATSSSASSFVALYNLQTNTSQDIGDGTESDISGNGQYVVFTSFAKLTADDDNTRWDVYLYNTQTSSFERISVSAQTNDSDSYAASISSDGRFVAFASTASNLVSGDTNNASDIFLRDRQTSQTTRISVTSGGQQANGASSSPQISADGRYVTFVSAATNLVSGDTNNKQDIFVRDTQLGVTYRIPSSGTSNNLSDNPDISADGNYVVFQSLSSDLVGGDTNTSMDVFVAQRSSFTPATATPPTPTITGVPSMTPLPTGTLGAGTLNCNPNGSMVSASVNSNNLQALGDSRSEVISANGQYVAFVSFATNLVPNDTNGIPDVFRFDRSTCTTIRVSEAPDGTQGNGNSAAPSISADGRYVAFDSFSSNLVSGDTNGQWDVFVRDLQLNTIKRIQIVPNNSTYATSGFPSISDDGIYVTFQSMLGNNTQVEVYNLSTDQRVTVSTEGRNATISGDGRYIAFITDLNLVSGDTLNNTDIYVYDRQTQQYDRITPDGAVFSTYRASISYDGRYVTFMSGASTVIQGDTNGYPDIFLRDRQLGQTTRVSLANDGAQANQGSYDATISGDGHYVVFTSYATNLVAGDGGNFLDVFVRDLVNSQTYKISVGQNGALADWDTYNGDKPDIANDGSYITFSSYAKNLIAGDINGSFDIFVAQRSSFAQVIPSATPTWTPTATSTPQATGTFGPGNIACNPTGAMVTASVSSGGLQGNADSSSPVISANGRYIAFVSYASNLTPNGGGILRFDRLTCTTILVSQAPNGTQGNSISASPSISADGRYVAFESLASNLVSGDTNNNWDVFVRDLQLNTIKRIQIASDNAGYLASGVPSISDDGRFVAFQSLSGNTIPVEVYDLSTNQRITVASEGRNPVISGDGRYIAFATNLNLVSGDTLNNTDVYVYDRQTQQYDRITPDGAVGITYKMSISYDGRFVSFVGGSSNLVANDTNGYADIFVRDRQLGQTTRVSVASDGTQANSSSEYGSISGNGRYVVFTSKATNLVAGDGGNFLDVFVRDILNNQTYKISVGLNGALADWDSSNGIDISDNDVDISDDGSYITFSSYAKNLIAGDSNGYYDIFVAQRGAYEPAYLQATATANAAATATYTANNTLVVNTTSVTDDGVCNAAHCSIVEAVNASNATSGVQTITFNIPGTAVKKITLTSSLVLTSSVIIDGTTQPGYAGVPLIEIASFSQNIVNYGFTINGANPNIYDPNTSVTIRGLWINMFSMYGILANNGQNHLIENNYIGLDVHDNIHGSSGTGIAMSAPNSIIRNNVLSGNANMGIFLFNNGDRKATNNLIVGNKIGTDATGNKATPNHIGIYISDGASNNIIGGNTPAAANIISGNTEEGIWITSGSPPSATNGNVIKGNIIGLTASGDNLLGNFKEGILITGATNTLIGGATVAEGNQIWGNNIGIYAINGLNTNGTLNTTIRNNTIVQNGKTGIAIEADNTIISDNTIAYHTGTGFYGYGPGTGMGINILGGFHNRISHNSIFSNDGMGIKLREFYFPVPNDLGDDDSGPNDGQNYPVISSVVTTGVNSTITGTLNSLPNQPYHLEFFSNDTCPAGSYGQYGQGRNYLNAADVTTDANGDAAFTLQVPAIASGSDFGKNWSGQFFPSNNLTGTGVAVSNINGLNFNWGYAAPIVNGVAVPGIPADNFSARFTSTQSFSAGTYTFNVTSDDGVRMYIDGTIVLDDFNPHPLTTNQFSAALSEGTHTLTVEYLEGKDQALLQVMWYAAGTFPSFVVSTATDSTGNTSEFSLCAPVQSILGIGDYQETNPNIVLNGTWINYVGNGPQGGAYKYTNDPNAKLNFYVDNTVGRITIYRTTYSNYGSTAIFMDGSQIALMNNTSSTLLFAVPYTIAIPSGNHLIELRNVVGSGYMSIDQVDLLPPAQALTTAPGIYQDRNINLSYSGKWSLNTNQALLGASSRYTNDPNARVSFNIDSSVGQVILYRTTYLASTYGSFQVYVDNVLTTTMNNTSSGFVFGVPFVFEVVPGNHTIELRNVGSTYSDIDQIKLLPPAAPISTTPGTYQEDEPNLAYSGIWTNTNTASALGGTWKYTNDPNATVSFKTDVSVGRVTIYRTTYQAGVYGSFQVYVDGTLLTTINNTSSTFQFQQPFTFEVTPASHIITLKNVGSTYSVLDQISLQAPTTPLAVGSHQETEPNLIFNGTWTNATTASALGNAWTVTNDPNATVSFKINNTVGKVTVYRATYVAGSYGSFQVYVDGALFTTINNTSSTFLTQQPFTFNVTPGNHTILIKNVGSTYGVLDQITLYAPPSSLPIGVYQETESNLSYAGNWSSSSTSSALGNAWTNTNDANASVTFSIDNTVGQITVYRATYLTGLYGSFQVYVDGALFTTINNTSSTFLTQQPFTFAVIPGNHTVMLKNGGSTYSNLDQITLEAPKTPLTIGSYQETDPNLIYNGTWTNTTTASALGGAWKYTNDANGNVTFSIDNTVGRVTVYRTTYQAGVYGSFQVYVDGVLATTINNTSSTFQFQQPFTFEVTPASHIITLKNVGSTYSVLDQISLQAPTTPLAVGSYQETEPNLIYNGTWTNTATSSALGGAWTYTNDPNATVSFKINNTVGKVTVYRSTYVAGSYGSFQVYVDGVLLTTINNTSSSFLTQQPFTFNVTPGNHTILIKNVGSTYGVLDQITLNAPA